MDDVLVSRLLADSEDERIYAYADAGIAFPDEWFTGAIERFNYGDRDSFTDGNSPANFDFDKAGPSYESVDQGGSKAGGRIVSIDPKVPWIDAAFRSGEEGPHRRMYQTSEPEPPTDYDSLRVLPNMREYQVLAKVIADAYVIAANHFAPVLIEMNITEDNKLGVVSYAQRKLQAIDSRRDPSFKDIVYELRRCRNRGIAKGIVPELLQDMDEGYQRLLELAILGD